MKKDVKSLLPVSLAAMEMPSTSNIDISLDPSLNVRENSGHSDTTNLDDFIPTVDGIPPNTVCLH